MDRRPLLRTKVPLLVVFLLKSTTFMWLQADSISGVDRNLHCLNDYLYTINCSLKMRSANTSACSSSHWLTFTRNYDLMTYKCALTSTEDGCLCSIITSTETYDYDYPVDTFTDLDVFNISLCHGDDGESDNCELLDEEYKPKNNIKPNAPCCLTVSHNSSQNHFTWKSTYNRDFTALVDYLQYQLTLYRTGDKHGEIGPIETDDEEYFVNDEKLVPDTEYAARVRSCPSMGHFGGQWSDWSSEVLWKTEPARNGVPTNTSTFVLRMVFIGLCVTVILVLPLCYVSVKKWRQGTFIPTPAPYFHTLYTDCKGDFKSWVITQESTPHTLKTEETLQIDTLIKCIEIQDDECLPIFQQHLTEGSAYSNIPVPVCDSDLLSMPYTDGSEGLLSDQGSTVHTLRVFSQSSSPAEDSGCWLCSDTSLEKEPPWYCNDYCTLTCFQQSGSIPGHNPGQPCPAGIISADAITEA